MRKLIILICIAITGGALYALVPNLFPNTPSFPRTPTADGTIGGVLQKIVGGIISDATDGTVANTEKLDGITATGYLKNNSCNIPDKWIGIDANGKAICGTSSPILADYGTVSEQGCPANIYHATGTNGTTNTGDTLKSGDIIKTGACGLTIAFTDFSILRLDADTTVSLDVLAAPAPSTQTIASAILSNGSLWGRILTDTGSYSIGTDKIVAGVRGTSVAVVQTGVTITMGSYSGATGKWPMTKVGTPSTPFLAIPHSQSSDNTISGDIGNATIKIGNSVTGPNMVNFTRNPVENLYQDSPWIRRNTANDLGYMYRLLAFSVEPLPKVTAEISISEPTSPTNPEAQNLCENGQTWWTSRYGCQNPGLYALADYILPVPVGATSPIPSQTTLLYSGSNMITPLGATLGGNPTVDASGVTIVNVGQYIEYPSSDPNFLSNLAGKTLIIELQSPIAPSSTKRYILDLGASGQLTLYKRTSLICGWSPCTVSENGNLITINLPQSITPNQMVLGAGYFPALSPQYQGPIGVGIKKITIQ